MRRRSSSLLPLLAPLFGLLLLGAGSARSQDPGNWNQEYDPHVAALGVAAGYTSGTGLALRWPALPQTMLGVAGGAWGESDDLDWNLGLELHYVLRQVGRTRLFAGPALAFFSDDEDGETDLNLSAGIGLEMLLRSRVSVKIDLGFTYLGDDEKIYPLPQLGVFYYF